MENEQSKNTLESLFESTSSLVDTKVELAKLKATKKTAKIVSSLLADLIIGGFVFIALMALSIAVGLWLGDLLGKTYYGFFAVTIFYAFLAIVLYFSRGKWLKSPVANAIIKTLNE